MFGLFGRKAKKAKKAKKAEKYKKPWKVRKYEMCHPVKTRRAKAFVKDARRNGWI